MTVMELSIQVRRAIVEVAAVPCRFDEIGLDDDLIASQIIDSLSFEELLARLEADFDITIADQDLAIANFSTPRAIEALVARLR